MEKSVFTLLWIAPAQPGKRCSEWGSVCERSEWNQVSGATLGADPIRQEIVSREQVRQLVGVLASPGLALLECRVDCCADEGRARFTLAQHDIDARLRANTQSDHRRL